MLLVHEISLQNAFNQIISLIISMKKFLTIIGALSLAVLIIMGINIGITVYQASKLDKESQKFVDTVIPQVLGHWDIAAFNQYADLTAMHKAGTTDDLIRKYFAWSDSKLGSMVEYGGSKGETLISYWNSEKTIRASYVAKAKFLKGDAQIKISLSKDKTGWKIMRLHIDSPVYKNNP